MSNSYTPFTTAAAQLQSAMVALQKSIKRGENQRIQNYQQVAKIPITLVDSLGNSVASTNDPTTVTCEATCTVDFIVPFTGEPLFTYGSALDYGSWAVPTSPIQTLQNEIAQAEAQILLAERVGSGRGCFPVLNAVVLDWKKEATGPWSSSSSAPGSGGLPGSALPFHYGASVGVVVTGMVGQVIWLHCMFSGYGEPYGNATPSAVSSTLLSTETSTGTSEAVG